MRIDQLWRYPVKSFGGERVAAATIEADGVRGDHIWAVVDPESGDVATAKRFRRWGSLLTCRARLLDDSDPRDPAALEFTLPDGTIVHGNDADVTDLLSQVTGRTVRLEPRPRTYDEAPLHVVSRSAVEALETGDATEIAVRRFRPQIVVDTPGMPGFVEDEWLGRCVGFGSAVVEPHKLTARCVMVTLPHHEAPARRETLRSLTSRHLVPNRPGGKPAPCIGIYANVVEQGVVSEGNSVDVR